MGSHLHGAGHGLSIAPAGLFGSMVEEWLDRLPSRAGHKGLGGAGNRIGEQSITAAVGLETLASQEPCAWSKKQLSRC